MEEYRPRDRRPIAAGFRRTAAAATDACCHWGIHPDLVSYASVVASMGGAACFLGSATSRWLLVVAPAFLHLRLWLNMLDGMVALASGKASRRGEILNELPDRVSDVLIFASVAHSGLCSQELGYWSAVLALMTAYVGTLGQAVAGRREFGGLMSKPWRMVTLHAGAWAAFALHLSTGSDWIGPLTALDWACVLVVVGCLQTIALRLSRTLRLLREERRSTAES